MRAIPIAMSFLAISVVWPQIIHPASHVGVDWSDFVRGAIFGLAIGIVLITAIHRRRAPDSTGTSPDSLP
jgi:hypothetical protein